jgi:hypothetical protein
MASGGHIRKSRQHHVWQHYLRAWEDNGRVHCLQNESIFAAGTNALGIERDFYKLGLLTQKDVDTIRLLALGNVHPAVRENAQRVLRQLYGPMSYLEGNRANLKNVEQVEDLVDVHNTNALDDFYTATEGAFHPLLDRTLQRDLTWFHSNGDCISFCNFLGSQYMRTKGVKERTLERLNDPESVDLTRVWGVLGLLLGINIGCGLYLERNRRVPLLIENQTTEKFITGDQPVINLQAKEFAAPELLSIYYPVSPALALYLPEPGERHSLSAILIDAAEVRVLNQKMARASHSQVYGQDAKSLAEVQGYRVNQSGEL